MSDNRYEAIDVANTVGADGCWYDRFLWDARGGQPRVGTALVQVLDAASRSPPAVTPSPTSRTTTTPP